MTKVRQVPVLTNAQRRSKDKLDAAMMLIKLNGQSRTPTRAALALIKLNREGVIALQNQQRRQEEEVEKARKVKEVKKVKSRAKRAAEKENPAEQFRALQQFRHRYSTRLRASQGAGGGDVQNVADGSDGEL